MKKTIITLMALAGVAMAEPFGVEASALNGTYGAVVGPSAMPADTESNCLVATQVISATSTYLELATTLEQKDTWYLSSSRNGNLGGYSPNVNGVTLVAGGPAAAGPSAVAAIKFDVAANILQECGETFALTFDIQKITNVGNNNVNHSYTFSLLSADYRVDSLTYHAMEGDNIVNVVPSVGTSTVELTFNAEQLSALKASGTDQTLVLVAATTETAGNRGILMNNFMFIPEPSTATLSLLALAGLAARRRRK